MSSPMSLKAYKELHDQLLAQKPEGAVHDECVLCAMTDDEGGVVGHTDEELTAAVESATAPLKARIDELEASQQVSETEAKVAAVKAELEAELAKVQAELDAKVLEAAAEKERADSILSWLEGEAEAQAEQEAIAARREDRLNKVKEVASFPQDYLDKNADRFAAMSDEDFEAALDSWKAITAAKGGSEGLPTSLPQTTALTAGREDIQGSAIKEMFALRKSGRVDLTGLSPTV